MELKDEEEHVHARLVLMLNDGQMTRIKTFSDEMRLEWPEMSLSRIVQLYEAYCGMDGRLRPYLSIETGERLGKST